MARILTYEDLFPSTTAMHQAPGNGTIAVPGAGDARLYAPDGINCQFYIGDSTGKAPVLYEHLSSMWICSQPGQPLFVETKLFGFSGTTNLRIAGLVIANGLPGASYSSYQFGWYKSDGKLHVWLDYPNTEVEIVTAVTVVDPATTPHLYRVYWNPYNWAMHIPEINTTLAPNYLAFAYSINAGVTWTNLGTRNHDFDIGGAYAGVYLRKWETSAVHAQADFEYFKAFEYSPSDTKYLPDVSGSNQDRVGFEDVGGLLNQSSGPARFDSPDGIKDSVNIADVQPRASFEDAYLLPQVAGRDVRFDSPDGLREEYPFTPQRVSIEESLFVQLDNTDYIKAKYDVDGREFLGNYGVRHILYYDATLDPWHTHGAGFYGAGRDGKLYYNGVECGPGDFGTLADGRRKSAWSGPGDFVDVGYVAAPTITADGVMQCATVAQINSGVSSRMRWFFTGDFDVQVDYEIVLNGSGPTDGGLYLFAYMDPNNCFYVRRKMWGTGAPRYDKDVRNNGAWGSYAFAATTDTSGRLRLTRVGAVVAAYYWSGSAWVQIGSNATMTHTKPLYIDCYAGSTAVTMTVKFSNFTINSGATTSLIGWAREAAGTYRGSLAEFPQHALIVSSGNSLDIIDADTDKLWMSFRGVTNNLIGGPDATYYVNQVVMKNGTLFVAYRTLDTATSTGQGYWIDFTLDFVRLHRGTAPADAGYIYNVELTTGVWPRDSANGCIAFRNSARAYYSSHFDNWQYQDPRANWVDILHDGGYQYRLIANNGGVYMSKWQRWKFEGTGNAHLNTPEYGIGTQTVTTRWAMFRSTSRDILAHNRIKLWVTHYATWNATIGGGGGTWLEDHEYTLAGTVDSYVNGALAQDSMTLDDTADLLFYARNEGVYAMDLTTGASTLFYGKVGSGATHEVLPDYALVSSVKLATDGATSLLIVGMARPDRIWAVNRTTHTIYWRGFQDDAHQPLSMAVGV